MTRADSRTDLVMYMELNNQVARQVVRGASQMGVEAFPCPAGYQIRPTPARVFPVYYRGMRIDSVSPEFKLIPVKGELILRRTQ